MESDFGIGDHILELYGADKCYDGAMNIRFKKDDGNFKSINFFELEF